MLKKILIANRTALGIVVATALVAAAPAAACTMPVGKNARDFNRAWMARIKEAPIVVEGYVVVSKFQAGKPPPRPVARLIVRKTYKGPRKATHALNYYPTTCHVPFPRNNVTRQKVYLNGANGQFHIVHVEPLK
jgi:opacity protein-like surface antigen